MSDEIKCPQCGSTRWRCWDEKNEWFEDENGELYEAPVGFLACLDCESAYIHHYETGSKHIGDDRQAFGDYD